MEFDLPNAKRLNKLKISDYVASQLQALIITEKEWQLACQVLKLLEPFQLLTKDCSKNYALLSSVIPHARALKNFIGHQARCVLDLNAATNLAKNGRGVRKQVIQYFLGFKP